MPIVLGALTVFGGIVVLAMSRSDLERRRKILATPTSRIANAPGTGLVEIKGRIVPGEQGFVQTPFSHTPCVWYRICVEEYHSGHKGGGHWSKVHTECDGRVFYVDDGSGQLARVQPRNANVVLDVLNVAQSGTFRDPTPDLQAFLHSRGLHSTGLLGFNRSLRYREERLVPGDHLFALGPSMREAGPPMFDGYRTTTSTRLVLEGRIGEELLLTNKSEQQLASKLLLRFILGLVVCLMGLLFLLLAIAASV
jgi:hypothetical protein